MTWLPVAALVAAQIAYPLAPGPGLTVAIVLLGFLASTLHAGLTRGPSALATLLLVGTGGSLLVEAVGVATGFPFGPYEYSRSLGPTLLHVPLVVPLAWTWMAWPALVVAGRLVTSTWARVLVGGVALATWDLFLDPQQVAAGSWTWAGGTIPWTNYLAWLLVAILMMTPLSRWAAPPPTQARRDTPMHALYLWTWASSTLAHAVFLDLPGSALRGGIGMGLVAVPLAVTLARR